MDDRRSPHEDQVASERQRQSELSQADRDSGDNSSNSRLEDSNEPPTGLRSFAGGLAGPAILLAILAFALPLLVDAIAGLGVPSFLSEQTIIQSFVVPPLICFSIVTVTPLFWYGPITLRFLAGVLSVIPGLLALAGGIAVTFPNFPPGFWAGFAPMIFAQFAGAGVIAVLAQLFSPWTLTHRRQENSTSIPPTGTRTMMELTGIAAVGFAFIASQSLQDMMEALIFFGGVGIISGPVVIGIERTMLRRNRRHKKRSIAFAVGSAYLIAIFFSGYFALMQFGPNAWLAYLHVILLVSLWGTVLICGTFAICLAWLRYWGWACVDRSMNH